VSCFDHTVFSIAGLSRSPAIQHFTNLQVLLTGENRGRIIDVSRAAARELDMIDDGAAILPSGSRPRVADSFTFKIVPGKPVRV